MSNYQIELYKKWFGWEAVIRSYGISGPTFWSFSKEGAESGARNWIKKITRKPDEVIDV
jgi:hypothetical protein